MSALAAGCCNIVLALCSLCSHWKAGGMGGEAKISNRVMTTDGKAGNYARV